MTDARSDMPDHHALLYIEDRLARLEELLPLIAMAGEGQDPPHSAALSRVLQLAQDQAGGIRKGVIRLARGVASFQLLFRPACPLRRASRMRFPR